MAYPISVLRILLDGELGANTSPTVYANLNRYRQIKAAVEALSRDKPATCTEDADGTGTRYYALSGAGAVLSNWVEGFSRVLAIEYPAQAVSTDHEPQMLEPEDWDDDYWVSGVRYLRLPHHTPATTEVLRVKFSTPYTWTQSTITTAVNQEGHGFEVGDAVYQDGTTWTVADDPSVATHIISAVTGADNATAAEMQTDVDPRDLSAVVKLAAAYCCRAIAAHYSNTSDSTLNLDAVNHTTRAGEFARRAGEFEKAYRTHLGLDAQQQARPAGAFVDWDTQPGGLASRRYVYHRGR